MFGQGVPSFQRLTGSYLPFSFGKSQQAYARGDGQAAHQLSEEGKRHGAQMDQYNRQASEYIFRENNAEGRVASDTIDLHGQFVEEAEDILEIRIREAQRQGQTHLHVIVGKGNHSQNHIQKIKPRVERVCQELGLQYHTEANEGRMYINLKGGPAIPPPGTGYGGGGGYQQQGQQHSGGGPQHHNGPQYQQSGGYVPQQQQQYSGGQNDQNEEMEKLVKSCLPRIFKQCCVVM